MRWRCWYAAWTMPAASGRCMSPIEVINEKIKMLRGEFLAKNHARRGHHFHEGGGQGGCCGADLYPPPLGTTSRHPMITVGSVLSVVPPSFSSTARTTSCSTSRRSICTGIFRMRQPWHRRCQYFEAQRQYPALFLGPTVYTAVWGILNIQIIMF